MKTNELKKLLKLARDMGVSHMRVGDLDVTFFEKLKAQAANQKHTPVTFTQAVSAFASDQVVTSGADSKAGRPPTEDELMNWSTGFGPSVDEFGMVITEVKQ